MLSARSSAPNNDSDLQRSPRPQFISERHDRLVGETEIHSSKSGTNSGYSETILCSKLIAKAPSPTLVTNALDAPRSEVAGREEAPNARLQHAGAPTSDTVPPRGISAITGSRMGIDTYV